MSTKGGVGKSTTAANLGAFCADAGFSVLLIDLDAQPTLSSYYRLEYEAPGGIYEFVAANETRQEAIVSKTNIPNLDIIISNDSKGQLDTLLLNAADGRLRLFNLLPAFAPLYDLVLIDTKGTRCITLEMAMLAANRAVSPILPEILPAREFQRGTMELYGELQTFSRLGLRLPSINLFINRAEYVSTDARLITDGLRRSFRDDPVVHILDTAVPHIASYRKAATLEMPAHRFETKRPSGRKAPSCFETMQALAIEVFPEWEKRLSAFSPSNLPEPPVAVEEDLE
jgi:chromosome partitioning related protein ParA